MRLRFCGVRGSTPAPGAEFVDVGGNTSCVAVLREGQEVPALVLDAGTGLAHLSRWIDHRPFDGTILLTHLHWDHVQGLPFFRAGDQPAARVTLVMPAQADGTEPADVLRRAMSPPHFPIGPEGLQGAWTFAAMDAGAATVEGFEVTAADVPHKGGRTFGYRIAADGRSVAYLPDHRPAVVGDTTGDAARGLCHGVDVLVHDAQFLTPELALAEDYGHATVEEAIAFAESCGAGRLVLFHHGPGRTDEQVAAIEASLADAPLPITVAREGAVLEIR